MTKNDFYNGWTIMIFDAGMPGKSARWMMAVKNGRTLDFDGEVVNDEDALNFARRQIDSLEKGN